MDFKSCLLIPLICGLGEAQSANLTTNPTVIFEGEVVSLEVSFADDESCSSYIADVQKVEGEVYRVQVTPSDPVSCIELSPIAPRPSFVSVNLPKLSPGTVSVELDLPGRYESAAEFELRVFSSREKVFRKVALESPIANATVSGIGLIRGWACQAIGFPGVFTYTIDSGETSTLPYGSVRTDTTNTCKRGDVALSPNTGFGGVVNWNAFSQGAHVLNLFLNGVKVSERSFIVAKTKGEFLMGLSKELEVLDFPSVGDTSRLGWSQADQNFIITNTD